MGQLRRIAEKGVHKSKSLNGDSQRRCTAQGMGPQLFGREAHSKWDIDARILWSTVTGPENRDHVKGIVMACLFGRMGGQLLVQEGAATRGSLKIRHNY